MLFCFFSLSFMNQSGNKSAFLKQRENWVDLFIGGKALNLFPFGPTLVSVQNLQEQIQRKFGLAFVVLVDRSCSAAT